MPTPVAIILVVVAIGLIVWQIRRNRIEEPAEGSSSDVRQPTVSESVPSETESTGEMSEEELVAVLTAAVYAYMAGEYNNKLRVRSFRRIPTTTPIWNLVGRKELLESKL